MQCLFLTDSSCLKQTAIEKRGIYYPYGYIVHIPEALLLLYFVREEGAV